VRGGKSRPTHDLAAIYGGKAFVKNPPDVGEFDLVARVAGLSGIVRENRGHPLNQKEVAMTYGTEPTPECGCGADSKNEKGVNS